MAPSGVLSRAWESWLQHIFQPVVAKLPDAVSTVHDRQGSKLTNGYSLWFRGNARTPSRLAIIRWLKVRKTTVGVRMLRIRAWGDRRCLPGSDTAECISCTKYLYSKKNKIKSLYFIKREFWCVRSTLPQDRKFFIRSGSINFLLITAALRWLLTDNSGAALIYYW
jgi:hypothetical protein